MNLRNILIIGVAFKMNFHWNMHFLFSRLRTMKKIFLGQISSNYEHQEKKNPRRLPGRKKAKIITYPIPNEKNTDILANSKMIDSGLKSCTESASGELKQKLEEIYE